MIYRIYENRVSRTLLLRRRLMEQ